MRQPGAETQTFELIDSVIAVATDIGAVEMLDAIRGWFADELPDSTMADLPWTEGHISRSYEACRDEQLGRGKGYVRSVKREIGWWAGFAEDQPVKPGPAPAGAPARNGAKIGRNDPCPCGSGKKYKKCHGA